MSSYSFKELKGAPLVIDAVYKSKSTLFGEDALSKLLPKCANQGGLRVVSRQDGTRLPAYIVLYTSFEEIEWPDYLDVESGILRYYGDNRTPGKELHDTPRNGNKYLREIFSWIDMPENRKDIPPLLVFRKTNHAFDVQFLGVAVPSNPNISPENELFAIWRTKDGKRFQNYEAYFSILDTGNEVISKEWLRQLIDDHDGSINLAPAVWRKFIDQGRHAIKPLVALTRSTVPSKNDQLPNNKDDQEIIQTIRDYYSDNPFGFETCATKLVQMMDASFHEFDLTRPWRDGGRDAVGKYRIGNNHNPLYIDCALEAKCYGADNSVGVKQVSRLTSRIKHREFGVLVTTSFISQQAYKEIIDDGHPLLIVSASDIAKILRDHSMDIKDVKIWLSELGKAP